MTNNYDTISGSMLLNPRKALDGETPKSGGQQTAFNTQAAIDLLNKYILNPWTPPRISNPEASTYAALLGICIFQVFNPMGYAQYWIF